MKANKTEQKALTQMLNRIYREIREVEGEWGIQVGDADFRPRIEYFHDAVRAFSAGGGKGSEVRDRLSVEMLAYDIGMLRYIQTEPIPNPKNKVGKLSPFTEVVESGNLPRMAGDRTGLKPDAGVKYALADLYKSYSVLFSALLADAADRNYMSRIEENNAEVEDVSGLMHSVKESGEAQVDLEAMAESGVRTPDLMNKIIAAFHSGKLKRRSETKEALRKLKEIAQAVEKEGKAIETAHMTYATGQLAIYENSRDVIKKMAIKGFNIVGDFVAGAVAAAQRGQRGR